MPNATDKDRNTSRPALRSPLAAFARAGGRLADHFTVLGLRLGRRQSGVDPVSTARRGVLYPDTH
jgi:hypothetical protein